MPKTYKSQLLHPITDIRYRVNVLIVIDGDIIYLIQVKGFVWISEPMVGTIHSIMSENRVISALTGFCTVSILIKI